MTVSLNQLLQAYDGYLSSRLPRSDRVAYRQELAVRRESWWFKALPATGAVMPDFRLSDSLGTLSQQLRERPVILKFYRSHLCPFCTLELKAYQRAAAQIGQKGAAFVAITQDSEQQIMLTRTRDLLTYPIVHDGDAAIARQLDIAYRAGPTEQSILRQFGLPKTDLLTLPALFVIGPGRRISYAFIDPDPSVRADPKAAIEAIWPAL